MDSSICCLRLHKQVMLNLRCFRDLLVFTEEASLHTNTDLDMLKTKRRLY